MHCHAVRSQVLAPATLFVCVLFYAVPPPPLPFGQLALLRYCTWARRGGSKHYNLPSTRSRSLLPLPCWLGYRLDALLIVLLRAPCGFVVAACRNCSLPPYLVLAQLPRCAVRFGYAARCHPQPACNTRCTVCRRQPYPYRNAVLPTLQTCCRTCPAPRFPLPLIYLPQHLTHTLPHATHTVRQFFCVLHCLAF